MANIIRNADGKVKAKSRKIVSRTLRCEPASVGHWLTIRQTLADGTVDQTVYGVEEVGSQAGRSFELHRVEGDGLRHYTCHIGGEGQNACDCYQNARHGVCKHADALMVCLQRGLIEGGIPGAGDAELNDDPQDIY